MKARGDKEMQQKIAEEKAAFEAQMLEQQKILEGERQRNKEDMEKAMRAQLNEQQRQQQFREIDARL